VAKLWCVVADTPCATPADLVAKLALAARYAQDDWRLDLLYVQPLLDGLADEWAALSQAA